MSPYTFFLISALVFLVPFPFKWTKFLLPLAQFSARIHWLLKMTILSFHSFWLGIKILLKPMKT